MAIGAILVLLLVVAGLLVLVLSDDNPLLSALDNDDATEPPPLVEPAPGTNALPAGQNPLPDNLCPPEENSVRIINLTTADPALFEGKGEIITRGNGSKALEISASSDNPVRFEFDTMLSNGTLIAIVTFPEGPATVALASRVNQAGDYYGAIYDSSDQVSASRGSDQQVSPQPSSISPFDGQPDGLMLNTRGEKIQFLMDGSQLLEWRDTAPLPPGTFAFEVLEGKVLLEAVAICEGSGGPSLQSDQSVLFNDDFNDAAIKDDWAWVYEPDGWNLDGGNLIIPVLPGSGLIQNPGRNPLDLPALIMSPPDAPAYTIQVEVQVAPEQDFQGAGLVVLSDRLQEPLYSLMRVSCAPASEAGCQGDAVYFQRWGLIGDAQAPERIQVGGAGELPADSPISLMIHIGTERSEIGAWYSLDGQNWIKVGGGPLIGQRVGSVGLITSTGGKSTGEAIPAQFDNFVITAGAPGLP